MKAGSLVFVGRRGTAGKTKERERKRKREKERDDREETTLEKLPQAFRSLFFSPFLSLSWSFSCMGRCSAGTSMLSGDKVLFFTKPPSVAQARPIRRQWLVNSSQSGGKPRRDRGNGVILLMNYLSGQNNNVLSPTLLLRRFFLFLSLSLSLSLLFYFSFSLHVLPFRFTHLYRHFAKLSEKLFVRYFQSARHFRRHFRFHDWPKNGEKQRERERERERELAV